MTNTTIRKSIFLKASRETVWDFLVQPDKLKIWFHAPKEPLVEGQDFTLYGAETGNRAIWGEVRKATAPEYLEYSFTVGAMDGAISTEKWTLDEVPGGTRLSLEHQGLPEGDAGIGLMFALDQGWDEHMGQMRSHLNENTN